MLRDKGKGMSMEYARNLFKADVKTSSRGTKGEKGSGPSDLFSVRTLSKPTRG